MYDNKTAIDETSKFIEAQPIREEGYPMEEISLLTNWVLTRIGYEIKFGVGEQSQQLEWFRFLLRLRCDKRTGKAHPAGMFMLSAWAERTENVYGIVYREGYDDGKAVGSHFATRQEVRKSEKAALRTKQNMSYRATKGRELIGAASREKVKGAAAAFMHLSKVNASYEMAKLVNLDPGTIRRYLSELFPGNEWKK